MGFIYSGSNTTLPIGRVEDYNNTNPSRSVAIYRTLQTSGTPMSFSPEVKHNTQFAKASTTMVLTVCSVLTQHQMFWLKTLI